MEAPWHNTADALSAFIAFEEELQLFDRALSGVAYWQLIRHDVFRETLEALGLAERAHLRLEEVPLAHWLGPQLRGLPRTLARSLPLLWPGAVERAELLVAAHPRQLLHEGRYICPYTQPLLWSTQHSRHLLVGHFQGRYFAPDAAERTSYVDLALAAAHAAFRARELVGRGLPASTRAQIAKLAQQLRRQLGAAPPEHALERRIRTAVLSALGLRPLLGRLLDRVRPRLVLNVVGYRLVNQLLTLAARERGIPVAELQHGTLGAAHAGYNFAPGRRPPAYPDQLLLFGEIWREVTPGLPLPAAATPAIGYAWLELQRARYPRSRSGTRPQRVLFLSQRGIGRELAGIAVQLQQRQVGVEICYRLHPSEGLRWQQLYPELASSGVQVEKADARPLYAAQAAADVQVGVYSTALLEGVAFGLQTYLVALPGHEQLAFLIEAGIAQRVGSAEALESALREGTQLPAASGDRLWAPDPQGNFQRFVEGVLSRK